MYPHTCVWVVSSAYVSDDVSEDQIGVGVEGSQGSRAWGQKGGWERHLSDWDTTTSQSSIWRKHVTCTYTPVFV